MSAAGRRQDGHAAEGYHEELTPAARAPRLATFSRGAVWSRYTRITQGGGCGRGTRTLRSQGRRGRGIHDQSRGEARRGSRAARRRNLTTTPQQGTRGSTADERVKEEETQSSSVNKSLLGETGARASDREAGSFFSAVGSCAHGRRCVCILFTMRRAARRLW